MVKFPETKMQNNTIAAAEETLRKDRLREEGLQEKLAKVRENLMRKIRSGKTRVTEDKSLDKHKAALRDLKVITEIKKSVDALKQNITKAE